MRGSLVSTVCHLVLCLAAIAPTASRAQQACQAAVYMPPTQGAGMTGTIMITFDSTGCAGTMTYAAFNPYSQNVTECMLLGGPLIGNSMLTLQGMATAGAAFPRRCSWYLRVTGTTAMTFMLNCNYDLICRMRVPTDGVGLPVELLDFSVEEKALLPVELMDFP